jgi:hypothetical protein
MRLIHKQITCQTVTILLPYHFHLANFLTPFLLMTHLLGGQIQIFNPLPLLPLLLLYLLIPLIIFLFLLLLPFPL